MVVVDNKDVVVGPFALVSGHVFRGPLAFDLVLLFVEVRDGFCYVFEDVLGEVD